MAADLFSVPFDETYTAYDFDLNGCLDPLLLQNCLGNEFDLPQPEIQDDNNSGLDLSQVLSKPRSIRPGPSKPRSIRPGPSKPRSIRPGPSKPRGTRPASSKTRSSQITPGKKVSKRTSFGCEEQRRETHETRKLGACIRCREQRTRCRLNLQDPGGECESCKKVVWESKKTIHQVPCIRGMLTHVTLFRNGGLNLTTRWSGTKIQDVGDRCSGTEIRQVEFTLGLCDNPIQIKVAKFKPREGDVTARFWMNNGHRMEIQLEPYCLDNIEATARYFQGYIETNYIPSLRKYAMGVEGLSSVKTVVKDTYIAALDHHAALCTIAKDEQVVPRQREIKERELLEDVFKFWFLSRHTTGMAYICGQETLGMKPVTHDDTYPLFGRTSLPRMIVAQFDSINSSLLKRCCKRLLERLQSMVRNQFPNSWWTLYLVFFILLHEASWKTADQYRHARANYGRKIRYSLPGFVQELQRGCIVLLCHWHYYNANAWPDPKCSSNRHESHLSELGSEQYTLVTYTMTIMANLKNGPDGMNVDLDWDHSAYWISQLFEGVWKPPQTYEPENVPS